MKASEYRPGIWLRKNIIGVTYPIKEQKFLTISDQPKTTDPLKRNVYVTAIQYPYGRIVDICLGTYMETCEPKDWRDTQRFMNVYNEHFECS